MKEKVLLNSASNTTGEGTGFQPDFSPDVLVVVTVTSAGTVALQGRLVSDATWVTINTTAATGGYIAQSFPIMRAVSTGVSGGVVRVTVGELEAGRAR